MMDLTKGKLIANLIEEAMQADLSDHDIAATLNLLAFTINRFIGATTRILLPVLREIKYCRSSHKVRFVIDGGVERGFLVLDMLSKVQYKGVRGERDGFTLILGEEDWISSRVEGSE